MHDIQLARTSTIRPVRCPKGRLPTATFVAPLEARDGHPERLVVAKYGGGLLNPDVLVALVEPDDERDPDEDPQDLEPYRWRYPTLPELQEAVAHAGKGFAWSFPPLLGVHSPHVPSEGCAVALSRLGVLEPNNWPELVTP